jgi:hypothetical protein
MSREFIAKNGLIVQNISGSTSFNTNFDGIQIPKENSYINFNQTISFSGYGFRDNDGILEFKNSGGTWNNFSSVSFDNDLKTYYISLNGNDITNDGTINKPYRTISKALTTIGNAQTQDEFRTYSATTYVVNISPGEYVEDITIPRRQLIDLNFYNSRLSGSVYYTCDTIYGSDIQVSHLKINANSLRPGAMGNSIPAVGIMGNVFFGSSAFTNRICLLELNNIYVNGKVLCHSSGNSSSHLQLYAENAVLNGGIDIDDNFGMSNGVYLYLNDCDRGGSGISGLGNSGATANNKFRLRTLNNVNFGMPVYIKGSVDVGRLTNVRFTNGSSFSGSTFSIDMDSISYDSYFNNVIKGTEIITLIDNAKGIATSGFTGILSGNTNIQSSLLVLDKLKISGLTDVNINNLSNGDMLVYSATTQKWYNQTPTDISTLFYTKTQTDNLFVTTGSTQDISGIKNFRNSVNISGNTNIIGELSLSGYSVNNLTYIPIDTSEPTGFIDRTSSIMSFNPSTREFTLSPTSGSFNYWVSGNRYRLSSSTGLTIPNILENNFIYFNNTNQFIWQPNVWTFKGNAQIAFIFWNPSGLTTGSVAAPTYSPDGYMLEERHGIDMDYATHQRLHNYDGTVSTALFSLSGFSVTPATPTQDTNTFSIEGGQIADEDIISILPSLPDGGPYTLFYRFGSNASDWRWFKNVPLPYLSSTTYITYNQNVGGSYQLTQLASNQYVNYYILGVPSVDTGYSYIIIPGQQVYASVALAQAESIYSLSLGNLPFSEVALLYQITWRANNTYTSVGGRCRIEAKPVRTFNQKISVSGLATTTDHQSLANRNATAAHPAISIDVNTSTFTNVLNSAHTDVQLALNEIDKIPKTNTIVLTIKDIDSYNTQNNKGYFTIPSYLNGKKLLDVKYNYYSYDSIYDDNSLKKYGLLAYDSYYFPVTGFTTMNRKSSGFGWYEYQNVQNDISGSSTGFAIVDFSAMTMNNLLFDDRTHAVGGFAFLRTKRILDYLGIFKTKAYTINDTLVGEQIGNTNKKLYISALIRKDINNDNGIFYNFSSDSLTFGESNYRFSIGYFSIPGNTGNTFRKWGFRINRNALESSDTPVYFLTSTPVITGNTSLLVLEIDHKYNICTFKMSAHNTINSANTYFIPQISATTAITYGTYGIGFRSIVFIPPSDEGQCSVSEVRVGETYESVAMTKTGANIKLNRIRSNISSSMINSDIYIPYGALTGNTSINTSNNDIQTNDIIEISEYISNPLSRGASATLTFG